MFYIEAEGWYVYSVETVIVAVQYLNKSSRVGK